MKYWPQLEDPIMERCLGPEGNGLISKGKSIDELTLNEPVGDVAWLEEGHWAVALVPSCLSLCFLAPQLL
jgi:hypothetical protein